MLHPVHANASTQLLGSQNECRTFISHSICNNRLSVCNGLQLVGYVSCPIISILATTNESTCNSMKLKPKRFSYWSLSKTPHDSATKALHFPEYLENPPNNTPFKHLITHPPHPATQLSLLAPSILILTHPTGGHFQPTSITLFVLVIYFMMVFFWIMWSLKIPIKNFLDPPNAECMTSQSPKISLFNIVSTPLYYTKS